MRRACSIDLNSFDELAFELQPAGGPPKLCWEKAKLDPDSASPLVLDGKVYALRGPILVTGNAKTGDVIGQLRLKGAFSSSPVAAGGLLYCFNEAGLAQDRLKLH